MQNNAGEAIVFWEKGPQMWFRIILNDNMERDEHSIVQAI